jgi:FkbM family methyltransferase
VTELGPIIERRTSRDTSMHWLQRLLGAARRMAKQSNQGEGMSADLEPQIGTLGERKAGIGEEIRATLDGVRSAIGELSNKADQSQRALLELGAKFDRLWLHVDFLRTRQMAYLGNGTALTYLVDETPVYTNANDYGVPYCFINGGRYEEDNLAVLLSFVRDDTVFLDIGANLGFFSLQVARRVQKHGKVHAFEPHPQLAELLYRNAYINGFYYVINCHRIGLSDQEGVVNIKYPTGFLAGGSLVVDHEKGTVVQATVRPLDQVLGADFQCDLAKIDVEGHELAVLRGMSRVVARSPNMKILFEKLGRNGVENTMEAYFAEHGFELFKVSAGTRLEKLPAGALEAWSGYVFAARPGQVEAEQRARFFVYPSQLLGPGASASPGGVMQVAVPENHVLFHGPYWFLPRGLWRLKVHGAFMGRIEIIIAEEGHRVLSLELNEGQAEHTFAISRDLVFFQCVAYARGGPASIELEKLELVREG